MLQPRPVHLTPFVSRPGAPGTTLVQASCTDEETSLRPEQKGIRTAVTALQAHKHSCCTATIATAALQTGSGAVRSWARRMTSSTSWKEEDFYVDREGIPHWDGVDMRHLKQYKARVTIEYEGVIGDNEEAQRKRATLGLRLTRGLTFKAWGVVEPLLEQIEN